MKVPATVFQVFASSCWGGGEKFVCDISRELAAAGCRTVLISRRSKVLRDCTAAMKMPHAELPMCGAADLFSAAKIARMAVRERPQIIHIHQFKDAFTVILAAKLCRLFSGFSPRIVVTRHLVRKGKGGIFHRWIYRHVDRIVFVSEFSRREFLSSNPPVDTAKTVVIRNAVPDADPAQTAPDIRKRFGLDADTPLILFCGRICREKGCDVLLKASTHLGGRKFAVVLVGTGDEGYVGSLKAMAEALNIGSNVFFYGFSDAVPALLRQADIAAAPSVASEAGGPFSTMEAMQAGVAAISSDNGAQPEFTDNGVDGLLIPPADEQALADAIIRLLDDAALRQRMGRAAEEKYRRELSYQTFFRNYLELYNNLQQHP